MKKIRPKIIILTTAISVPLAIVAFFLLKPKNIQLANNYDKQIAELQKDVAGLKKQAESKSTTSKEFLATLKDVKDIKIDDAIFSDSTRGKFFASSRGLKYYPVDSTAGASILERNRVYFLTEQDAVNAGYRSFDYVEPTTPLNKLTVVPIISLP